MIDVPNSKPLNVDAIRSSVKASVLAAERRRQPYAHAFVEQFLPGSLAADLDALPLAAPPEPSDGGTREANNATRVYFDHANMAKFPIMAAIAEALQSTELVRCFAESFDASLDKTFLRLEYAQDRSGFWLQPHTDLGVKRFTLLLYLSDGEGHASLGTDIYSDRDTRVDRSPFRRNSAMIFVPGSDTWHGFEPRPFEDIRRSMILNYVTPEWRAREQLCFPDQPVRH